MRVTGLEQARIRQDVDQFFDKTAHLYPVTSTRAGNGAAKSAYPANPTRTSPAQIAPMGDQVESFYADKLGGRQGFTVSLRDSIRVALDDQIQIDGRTYLVVGSSSGRSYQWRTRVDVKEVS